MRLESNAFSHECPIPSEYTCEGADVSPPLSWSEVPHETKSFVLIVDDPDAPDPKRPVRVWTHWLIYNLPATTRQLDRGVSRLPPGALRGINDWHRLGYGGPCPPAGLHRYFFKLYALDAMLPDLHNPNKAALQRAIHDHVVEEAHLIGTYAMSRGAGRPE